MEGVMLKDRYRKGLQKLHERRRGGLKSKISDNVCAQQAQA